MQVNSTRARPHEKSLRSGDKYKTPSLADKLERSLNKTLST